MKQSVSDSLLLKFLQKETSEEENAEILNWVSDSEQNREKFRRIHRAFHLNGLKQHESEIDIEAAWNTLNNQMLNVKKLDQFGMGSVEREKSSAWIQESWIRKSKEGQNYWDGQRNVFWRVAASVAIILAVGVGSLWSRHFFSNQLQSKDIRFESPAGEKSKIVLADGTLVWLNSQTILNYNVLKPRSVTLDGEAYFEVAEDRKHPFEVMTTSGLKVTVLGTKFNLQSFAGENLVETTLEEGVVTITGIDNGRAVKLKPGQKATFNTRTNQLQVENVSAEIYSVWKNNELRFTDITFGELIPRIERWYGIKVEMDSGISTADRFTMTIKTESLRELLTMMQLTSKFDYEINGEEVIIHKK